MPVKCKLFYERTKIVATHSQRFCSDHDLLIEGQDDKLKLHFFKFPSFPCKWGTNLQNWHSLEIRDQLYCNGYIQVIKTEIINCM